MLDQQRFSNRFKTDGKTPAVSCLHYTALAKLDRGASLSLTCLRAALIVLVLGCASDAPISSTSASWSHEFSALLKRHGWTFLEIPSSDISPGVIGERLAQGFDPKGHLRDCFHEDVLKGMQKQGPFKAAIPHLAKKYTFDAQAALRFLKNVEVGTKYSSVKRVEQKIADATTTNMSTLRLMQYTTERWPDMKDTYCGRELRKISTQVVTAVLRATELQLTFYDHQGAAIDLNTKEIGDFFSFGADVEYRITTEGGLQFSVQDPLPFAFKSVPFDIPEKRGKLEVLKPFIHFPHGQNKDWADIRNSGDATLNWRVTTYPERGFHLEINRGLLVPDQQTAITVARSPECIDLSKIYFFRMVVEQTGQQESVNISADDTCPSFPRAALSSRLDKGSAKFIEGEVLYQLGEFSAAAKELREAKQISPGVTATPSYQKVAGLVSYKTGNNAEALAHFQNLSQQSHAGHAYAAYVLASQGDFQKAKR